MGAPAFVSTARRVLTEKEWVTVTLLGLAGIGAVMARTTRYGATITPDSVNYLAAARSFAADGSLLRYDGLPFVHWPPLFPVALSVHAPSLTEAATTARWVNALAFGCIVAVTGHWLLDLLTNRWLAFVGTAIVAFSVPLLGVASSVWSEPLFILLCLLTLRTLASAWDRGVGARQVVVPASLAGMAMLTRYAGGLLVAACVAALLLPLRGPARRRGVAALAFVGIAGLPTALWVLRNRIVDGTVAGERSPPQVTSIQTYAQVVNTLTRWILPASVPPVVRSVVFLFVVAAAVFVGWTARDVVRRVVSLHPAAVLCGLFAIVYAAGILVAGEVTRLDAPSSRTLAPLFVPAVIVACMLLDGSLPSLGRPRAPAVAAALGGLVLFELAMAVALATPGSQARVGSYSTPRWSHSQLMDHVRAEPVEDGMFTNEPAAVYLHTGKRIPDIVPYGFGERSDFDFAEFGGAVTLVWFSAGTSHDAGPRLDPAVTAEPQVVLADGGVYTVRPRAIR